MATLPIVTHYGIATKKDDNTYVFRTTSRWDSPTMHVKPDKLEFYHGETISFEQEVVDDELIVTCVEKEAFMVHAVGIHSTYTIPSGLKSIRLTYRYVPLPLAPTVVSHREEQDFTVIKYDMGDGSSATFHILK